MKKIKWILLFLAFGITVVQKGVAQNITTVSGSINSYYNSVFDASGNMYFLGLYNVYRMDAVTGAVTNYAGDGSWGYMGDGGPATAAELNQPQYLAIDASDNIYIADMVNYRIRKVNTSGIISTYAGTGTNGWSGDGGQATDAELYLPLAICFDLYGNLYTTVANRIRKIAPSGVITTIAGNGSWGYTGDGGYATDAELSFPRGICADQEGVYLYIADNENNCIRRIGTSVSSYITTVAGVGSSGYGGDGGAATAALLHFPYDIRVDCNENIYVADKGNHKIRKFIDGGNITTFAGSGTAGTTGDGGLAATAELYDPINVSIDQIGNLYLPDDNDIRMVCNEYSTPTVTITGDGSNCTSISSNTFNATASGCGTDLIYSWYVGTAGPFVTTVPTYTDPYPVPGKAVYCTVTLANNTINSYCATGVTNTSNTVYEEGSNPVKITSMDINTRCATTYSGGPTPQFTSTISGGYGGFTYNWYPVTPFGYSSALTFLDPTNPNPTVNAAPAGTYTVVLTVTDAAGCSDTRNVPVTFISSGWDLATKDNPFDMYSEPFSASLTLDPALGNIWSSPDIFNRYYSGSFTTDQPNQPPIFDPIGSGLPRSNWLYVNVRNVGCVASPTSSSCSSPIVLSTYWTLASFGSSESWPANWTTTTIGTSLHVGLQLPDQTIPSIAAGSNLVMGQDWPPPNPSVYPGSPVNPELCFLSRIVDQHNDPGCTDPYGMTIAETMGNPSPNVRNNNNISTMNTGVMAGTFRPAPHVFYTGVGTDIGNSKVTVQIANNNLLYNTGPSQLSNYMSFKVYLGTLYDAWAASGYYGTYVSMDANDKSVTFDGSTTITLDSIVFDTGVSYPITVVPSMLPGVSGALMSPEMITFRTYTDDTSGIPLGNYAFTVTYDSTSPKGVLAVTEISQGPASNPGCEYAELIVSGCDTVASRFVDVRGWIIDDNNGEFDLAGCTLGNGITKGHYRLAYDSIWRYMQIGSIIVVYNQAANCYSLPDTFLVDSVNNIYYVPVSATAPSGTYVLQQFTGAENTSMCSYCSDTGRTVYTNAADWAGIIDLSTDKDAFQVRCPGCTPSNPGSPANYHGMGFAPTNLSGFTSAIAGPNDIGYNYITNANLSHRKYVFGGSAGTDLSNPAKWTVSAADAAGFAPSTLGSVPSGLSTAVATSTLGLPCCGGVLGYRHANPNPNTGNTGGGTLPVAANKAIKVYPNPANMVVYFEFPMSADVAIRVMDITGRLIELRDLHNTAATTFDISNYKPGIYLYQVVAGSEVQTGKIVVE